MANNEMKETRHLQLHSTCKDKLIQRILSTWNLLQTNFCVWNRQEVWFIKDFGLFSVRFKQVSLYILHVQHTNQFFSVKLQIILTF